jgi:hypothetical protein
MAAVEWANDQYKCRGGGCVHRCLFHGCKK